MRLLQHMMAIAVIVVMVILLAIAIHVVQVLVVLVATVMAHVTAPLLVMPSSLYLAARVALAGRQSQTSLLVAEVTTAEHHKTRNIKHNQLPFFVRYFGSTQRLVMYTCAYFKAFLQGVSSEWLWRGVSPCRKY